MDFRPLNELEICLLAAKSNRTTVDDFVRKLVASDLAFPTAGEVQQDGEGFSPLIYDRNGTSMVAAFTDKTRLSQLSAIAPYCLVMNALQFFMRIPRGCGVVINPGFSVGLELSPDGIANIVRDFGAFNVARTSGGGSA